MQTQIHTMELELRSEARAKSKEDEKKRITPQKMYRRRSEEKTFPNLPDFIFVLFLQSFDAKANYPSRIVILSLY